MARAPYLRAQRSICAVAMLLLAPRVLCAAESGTMQVPEHRYALQHFGDGLGFWEEPVTGSKRLAPIHLARSAPARTGVSPSAPGVVITSVLLGGTERLHDSNPSAGY